MAAQSQRNIHKQNYRELCKMLGKYPHTRRDCEANDCYYDYGKKEEGTRCVPKMDQTGEKWKLMVPSNQLYDTVYGKPPIIVPYDNRDRVTFEKKIMTYGKHSIGDIKDAIFFALSAESGTAGIEDMINRFGGYVGYGKDTGTINLMYYFGKKFTLLVVKIINPTEKYINDEKIYTYVTTNVNDVEVIANYLFVPTHMPTEIERCNKYSNTTFGKCRTAKCWWDNMNNNCSKEYVHTAPTLFDGYIDAKNLESIIKNFYSKMEQIDRAKIGKTDNSFYDYINKDTKYETCLGTILQICRVTSKIKELILKKDNVDNVLTNFFQKIWEIHSIYISTLDEKKYDNEKILHLYSKLATFSDEHLNILPLSTRIDTVPNGNHVVHLRTKFNGPFFPIMNICLNITAILFPDTPFNMEYEFLFLPFVHYDQKRDRQITKVQLKEQKNVENIFERIDHFLLLFEDKVKKDQNFAKKYSVSKFFEIDHTKTEYETRKELIDDLSNLENRSFLRVDKMFNVSIFITGVFKMVILFCSQLPRSFAYNGILSIDILDGFTKFQDLVNPTDKRDQEMIDKYNGYIDDNEAFLEDIFWLSISNKSEETKMNVFIEKLRELIKEKNVKKTREALTYDAKYYLHERFANNINEKQYFERMNNYLKS